METRLFRGQEVKAVRHQKHRRRGILHSCELWPLLFATGFLQRLCREPCWVFSATVPHRTSHANNTRFSLHHLTTSACRWLHTWATLGFTGVGFLRGLLQVRNVRACFCYRRIFCARSSECSWPAAVSRRWNSTHRTKYSPANQRTPHTAEINRMSPSPEWLLRLAEDLRRPANRTKQRRRIFLWSTLTNCWRRYHRRRTSLASTSIPWLRRSKSHLRRTQKWWWFLRDFPVVSWTHSLSRPRRTSTAEIRNVSGTRLKLVRRVQQMTVWPWPRWYQGQWRWLKVRGHKESWVKGHQISWSRRLMSLVVVDNLHLWFINLCLTM